MVASGSSRLAVVTFGTITSGITPGACTGEDRSWDAAGAADHAVRAVVTSGTISIGITPGADKTTVVARGARARGVRMARGARARFVPGGGVRPGGVAAAARGVKQRAARRGVSGGAGSATGV